MNNFNHISKIIFFLSFFLLFANCEKAPTREIPTSSAERVKKNIEEGRGFRLKDIGGGSTTTYNFATSNEMWRASLDLLDFAPFTNVDYSGGIIVTDWFTDENNSDEALKITVRFLSNEIRADGLELIIHKKVCKENSICKTSKIESILSQEIKLAILKKAATLKKEGISKEKSKRKKTPIKTQFGRTK
jgi:hypothetical protein